jgi:hypothetical protein
MSCDSYLARLCWMLVVTMASLRAYVVPSFRFKPFDDVSDFQSASLSTKTINSFTNNLLPEIIVPFGTDLEYYFCPYLSIVVKSETVTSCFAGISSMDYLLETPQHLMVYSIRSRNT